MCTELTSSDLAVLLREVETTAARLVCRMDLSAHERDDLRQDLLVDLLARLKGFDPQRGSLAAFAAVVVRHGAALHVARIRRHRALFAPVSLDDPINGRDDATWGDTFTEEDGYLTWIGASANPIPALEGRLSLNRALNTLLPEHLSLCAKLLSTSIGCMDAESGPSRATLYRQVAEIRFCLLAAGIGPQT